MPYVIGYDLGTGGTKASLYRDDGVAVGRVFLEYATSYPEPDWHEQRPDDWWRAVCRSTARLLSENGIAAREVCAVAASGQSRVAAPLDRDGNPLLDSVPIWSDTRAVEQAREFFGRVPYERWYLTTGNGDPPATHSVMKLMWLRDHRPDVWRRTVSVLGSKDYINFRLTGSIATDPSHASGTGAFSLAEWRYEDEFVAAAGIDPAILPPIVDSHAVVGTVTRRAAEESGLAAGTIVACGGADNTCMALGARGIGDGRVYTSLGSSSWIAVTSRKPVLDCSTLPYVFAHAERGWYTSAVSIFAAGSAYRWARDELCRELMGDDAYERMNALAAASPAGANGVLFNPTLAGGSPQNVAAELRGAFAGITLATTRNDMLRAVLEGVAMDLACYCLDPLRRHVEVEEPMLVCGGGARSPLWRQILADVFDMDILKTCVDQDAASLGAAAVAARAAALWSDYRPIDALHLPEQLHRPDPDSRRRYDRLKGAYAEWTRSLADVGRRTRTWSDGWETRTAGQGASAPCRLPELRAAQPRAREEIG